MEKLVSLCRRRGILFQSSEIYGGLNGFWDYGPLGVELKRNIKEAWWQDMVTSHNELNICGDAPSRYSMTGIDTAIIMHPQVWKCSGHYDLFHDMMVDCRETQKRYRYDQIRGRWVEGKGQKIFVTTVADAANEQEDMLRSGLRFFKLRAKHAQKLVWQGQTIPLATLEDLHQTLAPNATQLGTLTPPREFNLMFRTTVGAMGEKDDYAFLRPETAQGIFVNFKNVLDSSRIRIPFGIAQIGKSFRNEITPRNFTFRSREFEQMEIEFFCHPDSSHDWYQFWRNRRFHWYTNLGLKSSRLRLRDHNHQELSHYSIGTADIEYAFPFLATNEFGELEGIAHRGDFDLRSHMEGKLDPSSPGLSLQLTDDGKPRYRGSGRDLTYRDDLSGERYVPHVIEPSAGADRATLAFLCEAYTEDEVPDEKGRPQVRTVMKFHPRIAPIKVAVLPLVKKDGMPEMAQKIYSEIKPYMTAFYDEKGAVGRRYRRQDEVGTPYSITIDGQSMRDQTVTIRDRDTLEQSRVSANTCVNELLSRLNATSNA